MICGIFLFQYFWYTDTYSCGLPGFVIIEKYPVYNIFSLYTYAGCLTNDNELGDIENAT